MNGSSSLNRCERCGAAVPEAAPQGLCPKCLLAGVAEMTEPLDDPPRPAPPELSAVAAALPQFEVIELIGQGGMGCVYKARQPGLNRHVALKILPEALAKDPAFPARFTREAQALAALNHPNIVTIHDFGKSGPFYYLVMEFVDGVNLRQALRGGKFQPEEALAMVPLICDALQFAHDRGIVHRDIKPENLLLDRNGRIKIADFGIAKMMHGGPAADERQPAGTPRYIAPEQKEKPESADHRADIYSLGVVLYEMLTGELPSGEIVPPSRKVRLDVRLDRVVLRALEQSPELRWQTAADFQTGLEQATPPPRPQNMASAVEQPPHEGRWKLAFLAALCLPAMALIWFVLGGHAVAGIDLNSSILPFWVSIVGFPAITAFGVTLAWLTGRGWVPGSSPDEQGQWRWSMRSILAAGMFGLSVLLMGGGVAILSLLSHEHTWNPGSSEFLFVICFLGGGILSAGLATLLGWSALRQLRQRGPFWRGWRPAYAAAWFWPLVGVFIVICLAAFRPTSESARLAQIRAELRHQAIMEGAAQKQREQILAAAEERRLESLPPVVVSTFPVSGDEAVVPGVTDIEVRFSVPMVRRSWSWVAAWEGSAPETLGNPKFVNETTCRMRVRLEPSRSYALWLNSENFRNFEGANGRPAVPYLLIFQTSGETEN